jgi:hypothetical protein
MAFLVTNFRKGLAVGCAANPLIFLHVSKYSCIMLKDVKDRFLV